MRHPHARGYATSTPLPYCYRHPDRETGLSCSECGRPICYDCMTPAPVGIRCPEHSGKPQGAKRVTQGVRRASFGGGAIVTKTLIAINVGVWLAMLATGASISDPSGTIFEKGALFGPFVAQGDWWRLVTAMFLHASLLHIAFNMLALWWVGAPLEQQIGRGRFLLLYFVSGLAGSAGALFQAPLSPTVGASGAIFGLFGAILVLERQGSYVLGGSVLGLIIFNLAISFYAAGISWGGHIGGLIGGMLCMLALTRFGRGHGAYGRLGLEGVAGVVVVGVLSVVAAYWKVRGYA
jgi:membrane associated rhomboid family serine protease